MSRDRLAVIVAAIDARATVAESLSRWHAEADELILVDASRDGTAEEAVRAFPDLRVVRRPPGRLAPELWRDGLDATDAVFVGFTTAAMVPAPGWRSAMLGRLEAKGASVVGGPIAPSDRLSATDRAVYLLRYARYLPPLAERPGCEPPGDNAVYRRASLRGLESTWADGFWEAEVHRALRSRGDQLAMAEGAPVVYRGGARLGPTLRHRLAHAHHYGASRAARMGRVERLARSAASGLVPAVLLGRIAASLMSRRLRLGPWVPALPPLSLLLLAWAAGEARGLCMETAEGKWLRENDKGKRPMTGDRG